jgi:hypothetical protein
MNSPALEKMAALLAPLSTVQLDEMIRLLAAEARNHSAAYDSAASALVWHVAINEMESRLSETEFVAFCDSL